MSNKRKICSWLDSNTRGGIQILGDSILPCCGPSEPLICEENLDYDALSVNDIQEKRKEFYELINENKLCLGCEQIIEKPEEDIDIGKIQYLSVGLFSTCNLRCRYCYFNHDQLGAKLSPKRTKLLPIVKKFADADMLKDTVVLGVAGGEPTLFEDIPETLNFLADRYPSPGFTLLSNSTLTEKTKKLAREMKKVNKKIAKTLYTSVDAGTAETYKAVRGRDLYHSVCKNVVNYAKKNTFNTIILKYILLFDHTNTKDKDIFGFLKLVKKVMLYNRGETMVTIDCDMLSKEPFDNEMIHAAGKLYYFANMILGLGISYQGGGLVHGNRQGRERINLLEEYARKYKESPKSFKENLYVAEFKFAALVKNIIRTFSIHNLKRLAHLLKIVYG